MYSSYHSNNAAFYFPCSHTFFLSIVPSHSPTFCCSKPYLLASYCSYMHHRQLLLLLSFSPLLPPSPIVVKVIPLPLSRLVLSAQLSASAPRNISVLVRRVLVLTGKKTSTHTLATSLTTTAAATAICSTVDTAAFTAPLSSASPLHSLSFSPISAPPPFFPPITTTALSSLYNYCLFILFLLLPLLLLLLLPLPSPTTTTTTTTTIFSSCPRAVVVGCGGMRVF